MPVEKASGDGPATHYGERTMTLANAKLAKTMRHFDWTADMSDSPSVWRYADARREEIKASLETKNHRRIHELATAYHAKFTWWSYDKPEATDAYIKQYTGLSRSEMFERGWRWAGAYLWAHGVEVTETEAMSFVGKPGDYEVKEHKRWGTNEVYATDTYSKCGIIDWNAIDKKIKAAGSN
jgi:hypothetical protein